MKGSVRALSLTSTRPPLSSRNPTYQCCNNQLFPNQLKVCRSLLLHHLRQPYHSLGGFARLHQIKANMAICQGKGLVNRLGSSLSLTNP